MKRILVIDESEVIRETLGLILGSEFAVTKRPPSSPSGFLPADASEEIDLLILGVAPRWRVQTGNLIRFASKLPFAVIFLVDSKSAARLISESDQITCLTKPFNPYDLQEQVERLLALGGAKTPKRQIEQPAHEDISYRPLEYPFVSRSVAMLAQRFGMSRLPILIYGEVGCGQSAVARAICHANSSYGSRVFIDAAAVTEASLDAKAAEIRSDSVGDLAPHTLIIENLERADARAQSSLAAFLEQRDNRLANVRLLTTAKADLLEKVYRGEFLDTTYYRLATLTLRLAPLRERREDIASLTDCFGRIYARRLGLGECVFSAAAKKRLSDYLWFGNLGELEAVVARTLAAHRKTLIGPSDLIFDFGAAVQIPEEQKGDFTEFVPSQSPMTSERGRVSIECADGGLKSGSNGHGKLPELSVVIHELAHELKNPMVTIKTFAQLLGDRYDDVDFRARFQEIVGGDIQRMDELLEMMVEFADFGAPRRDRVVLADKLRGAVEDVGVECRKRQTQIRCKETAGAGEIDADESQLAYILKQVLFAVLVQSKMGSDIEVTLDGGMATIDFAREGARLASINHYLSSPSEQTNETLLPLRILLAKQLLERNGGRLSVDQSGGDRETVRMEFSLG